jgi:hypothetical protein
MKFAQHKCPECGGIAVATLETLHGRGLLTFDEQTGEFDWQGETKVCYDSQQTHEDEMTNDLTLFCENDHEWQSSLDDAAFKTIPSAKPQPQNDDAVAVLKELVEWAGFMGGWESPVWDRAKSIAQQAAASASPEAKPSTKIVVSCSGGCVTAVYCTDENATAEIIDFDEFEGGEGEEERDPDDALDAATEGMACVY